MRYRIVASDKNKSAIANVVVQVLEYVPINVQPTIGAQSRRLRIGGEANIINGGNATDIA